MSKVWKAQEERVSREWTEASLFADRQTADITCKDRRGSCFSCCSAHSFLRAYVDLRARMSTRFSRFLSEHRVLELARFDAIPCLHARICVESRCVSPDIWLRRTVVAHDTTPIGNNIHTGLDKSY